MGKWQVQGSSKSNLQVEEGRSAYDSKDFSARGILGFGRNLVAVVPGSSHAVGQPIVVMPAVRTARRHRASTPCEDKMLLWLNEILKIHLQGTPE